MPLITNTRAQDLPLGEGKLQRLTGQMLGGTLAGDQVSQFAGAPPGSEQNGTEERTSIIILMKAKYWATRLF